jgi:hypothetical protein
MIDLLSPIPLSMQGISGEYIQSHIQIHEKDLFTGIIHLFYDKTERLLFFCRASWFQPIGCYYGMVKSLM